MRGDKMKVLTNKEIREISGGENNVAIICLSVASFVNLLIGLSNTSINNQQTELMLTLGTLTIAHEIQLAGLPGYEESTKWVEAQGLSFS